MKKTIIGFVAVATICCLTASAQASVLSNLLTFDSEVDRIDTNSVSKLEGSNPQVFEDGDIIWGMLRATGVQASTQPYEALGQGESAVAIVFSAKVNGTGSGGSFSLDPIGDDSNPFDLRNLLPGSVQNGLNDNSLLTVLSSPVLTVANDPLNWTTTELSNFASGWNWELTGDLADSDDFFEYLGTTRNGTDLGALTITSNGFFGVFDDSVEVLDYDFNSHFGSMTLDAGLVNPTVVDGWTFADTSTFYVNGTHITPEPVSMLTWAGLAGIGAAFAARRRRRKAA